jgi:hypothetical protein
MPTAHFIAKLNENLRPVDKTQHLYATGLWDIPDATAEQLIEGLIYLHKAKAKPSFFGGRVLGYRVVETDYAHSKRIEFEIESIAEARAVSWAGDTRTRDWWTGLIAD